MGRQDEVPASLQNGDAVEKRKMQFKIEEMEREMERRLEAERRGREASDSPRKSSTWGSGRRGGAEWGRRSGSLLLQR